MPKVSYPSVSSKRSPGKKPPSVVYRVGNWSAYHQARQTTGEFDGVVFYRSSRGVVVSGAPSTRRTISVFGPGD